MPEARRRYEGSEAEERRLFYVAMTRAKDVLYLSRFRKKQNKFQPSPFLVEVAGGDPPVTTSLLMPEPFVPPTDEQEELPMVSFSELATFEECPLRYRFSTSLGFQPQLVRELGYGRAIHHILRHVAELTVDRRQIGKIQPPMQRGELRYATPPRQREVQVVDVKMDQVELRGSL